MEKLLDNIAISILVSVLVCALIVLGLLMLKAPIVFASSVFIWLVMWAAFRVGNRE